jgi:hypothetical protein
VGFVCAVILDKPTRRLSISDDQCWKKAQGRISYLWNHVASEANKDGAQALQICGDAPCCIACTIRIKDHAKGEPSRQDATDLCSNKRIGMRGERVRKVVGALRRALEEQEELTKYVVL